VITVSPLSIILPAVLVLHAPHPPRGRRGCGSDRWWCT